MLVLVVTATAATATVGLLRLLGAESHMRSLRAMGVAETRSHPRMFSKVAVRLILKRSKLSAKLCNRHHNIAVGSRLALELILTR